MPVYDMVNNNPAYDIGNISQCIRHEDFIAMLPHVVLKTDAIKLGVCCFVAGIALGYLIYYLKARCEP